MSENIHINSRMGAGCPTSRVRWETGHSLDPIHPVPRPAPSVSYAKNHDFRREIPVDDTERKLPENVFSEIAEVDRPALGSFSDSFDRLLEGGFKVDGCDAAAMRLRSLYHVRDVRYSCSAWV
ncbi:MAG: hypothetical protein JWO20_1897 [Candidatus Angelobacter sp.]|nr:hypothetical protein [Candidatus Angelobacter sp.]